MSQFIYGKNVVKRLLLDNSEILDLYLAVDDETIIKLAKANKVKVSKVDKKTLKALCKSDNHQGVAAKVEPYKTVSVDDILNNISHKMGLIVVLDEIEDPHNLGAILRNCDAVKADGVIIKKHGSVQLNSTVAKVSAGAINTVKVASVTNISATLEYLKTKGYWVVGTDMVNAVDYRSLKYDTPIALVIGNEGKGISPLVKRHCDFMVKLPMMGKISSLNASVATGIILYEIYNKRFPL